jgi:hypothetical protein
MNICGTYLDCFSSQNTAFPHPALLQHDMSILNILARRLHPKLYFAVHPSLAFHADIDRFTSRNICMCRSHPNHSQPQRQHFRPAPQPFHSSKFPLSRLERSVRFATPGTGLVPLGQIYWRRRRGVSQSRVM